MLVLAHRGRHASHSFPDNSLDAIEAALGAGRDGVEIDVRLSADGVPVLWHDRTVRAGPHTRLVSKLTHAELSHAAKYAVAALPEVLRRFDGAWFDVEVKTDGALEAAEPALRRADPARLLVTSFRHDLIQAAAARLDSLRFGIIIAHRSPLVSPPWDGLGRVDSVVVDFDCATEDLADSAHAAGLRCFAWDVATSEDRCEAALMALDGIIVDA